MLEGGEKNFQNISILIEFWRRFWHGWHDGAGDARCASSARLRQLWPAEKHFPDVETLSCNLDGAYDDIIKRIDNQSEEDRELALRTLSWIIHAKRPLQPSRLSEALAVEPGATELDPDRQTDMEIILAVCAGLVVIDKEDDKVHLIHYTTQEYLQSTHVHTRIFPRAQSEITGTCFTYMSLTFKASPNLLEHESLLFTYNPFLHYAVEYCLIHAHGDPETDIQDSILSFLVNCSIWWRLWNWKHGGVRSAPNRLRIAMAFHLEVISSHIIEEDCASLALQEAVIRGAADEVVILVRNGVDLDSIRGALQEAVIRGHEGIVGTLLEHGTRGRQCTVLQGQEKIEMGGWDDRNWYGAALYHASSTGNEVIIRLLIKHGADINAHGGEYYGGALGAAATAGHESVVELLVQNGADVNVKARDTGSALQVAAWKGHWDIVQLLLKHGADINAKSGKYGSALQLACDRGHEVMARLLLEQGANVNAAMVNSCNALQLASKRGHETIVKVLLENGADINAGGEALRGASSTSRNAVVKPVVAPGEDDWDGGYGSALQIASEKGHEAIVRLLLEHGADANAKSSMHCSPLQLASRHGHETVIKLLVEHGAEGELEPRRMHTVRSEHREISHLFHDFSS